MLLETHLPNQLMAMVGKMTKIPMESTTAKSTERNSIAFHAAFSPNRLLIFCSNAEGSPQSSSGKFSSRISADSIRVPIPVNRESAKEIMPRRIGIFRSFPAGFSFFVRR